MHCLPTGRAHRLQARSQTTICASASLHRERLSNKLVSASSHAFLCPPTPKPPNHENPASSDIMNHDSQAADVHDNGVQLRTKDGRIARQVRSDHIRIDMVLPTTLDKARQTQIESSFQNWAIFFSANLDGWDLSQNAPNPSYLKFCMVGKKRNWRPSQNSYWAMTCPEHWGLWRCCFCYL